MYIADFTLNVYWLEGDRKVTYSNQLEHNRKNLKIFSIFMMKKSQIYDRIFNELLYHFSFIFYEDLK